MKPSFLLVSAVSSLLANSLLAADASSKAVSYYKDIRPIFQANCQGCHQPAKARGGYVMTDFKKLLAGGEKDGVAIVPGDPAKGSVLDQITPKDGQAEMPKNKPPLHELEIALVRRWIAEGAKDDTPADAKKHFDATNPPTYSRLPVIASVDISPDGTLVAVAGFHEILLHKTDGSGLAARLVGMSERVQSVRFSPDGKRLAAAAGDPGRLGEIQVWDVASKELKLSTPVGWDTLYGVSWSPDGTKLAFGCPDNTVRAIDASNGKQLLQMGSHNDWVLETTFNAAGDHVISVGRDMTAKLSELESQRFIDNLTSITPGALRGGINSVDKHPVDNTVVVGGSDGAPQLFQIFRTSARKIGDNANLIRKHTELPGRIFAVRVSGNGKRFVAGSALNGSGAVAIYSLSSENDQPADIKAIRAKDPGQRNGEENKKLNEYNEQFVKPVARLDLPQSTVYAVSINQDGSLTAAAGSDGLIRILDQEGKVKREFPAAPVSKTASVPLSPKKSAPARQDDAKQDAEPRPASKIKSLAVSPSSAVIQGKAGYVQTVVTATLENGDRIDVTRSAKFTARAPIAQITPRGRIEPLADGKSSIEITIDGTRAELPLEVAGTKHAYSADFIRDVNPVLTKLGCNQGTCHGSKEGKGGFKLSLRGYDPEYDLRTLTDDMASRRVTIASPDDSLMLLKTIAEVPHEGGRRTESDTHYYGILREWIAGGATLNAASAKVVSISLHPENPVTQLPGARQQFRIIANFADNSSRDVTAESFIESGNGDVATADQSGLITTLRRGEAPVLARYEGNYAATTLTVMGNRDGFQWQEPESWGRVDELVAAKWKRMRIEPSGIASDAEFLRRAHLDLTGLPPSANAVRAFLSDTRDTRTKRAAAIDSLIGTPDFVEYWTNKWADLLQVNAKFLGGKGAESFRNWIRQEIADNTPYDRFVSKILTASGSNKDNPAASYWKILRTPAEAMENTTHLFLATRFNCNKCHDHPFERWTQDQYYHTAAYFAQFQLKADPSSGDQRIGGTAVEGAKPLYEIVADAPGGEIKHDRTGKVTPPEFPFPAKLEVQEKASRREALASWMTAPDNRFFASSYVNRLWGYLLGVGIIEPIDDIRAGNPPTNPELLEYLTKEFVQSGFNTRHIIQLVCKSRTYQLSIKTNRWNEDDKTNYSHALARRLSAETLVDAVHTVTGSASAFPGAAKGARAASLFDLGSDLPGGLLGTLGRPARESACECERSNDIRLGSVMALLSGQAISQAIQSPENAIAKLVSTQPDDRKAIEELFIRVLARKPTEPEIDATLKNLGRINDDHQKVVKQRDELEKKHAPAIAAAEAARKAEMDKTKPPLDAYEAETKFYRDERERVRKERIAQAEAAAAAYEKDFSLRMTGWSSLQASIKHETLWDRTTPVANATDGVRLTVDKQGLVVSTGQNRKADYTVELDLAKAGTTGVLLELLPDSSLPGFGPGRGDAGTVFINEISATLAPKGKPDAAIKFAAAAASFETKENPVAQLIDGKADPKNGWSLAGGNGVRRLVMLKLPQPTEAAGSRLKLKIVQRGVADGALIARFRVWSTTAANPLQAGIASDLQALLAKDDKTKTADDKKQLATTYRMLDDEYWIRARAVAEAKLALPADPKHESLKAAYAKASEPIRLDAQLVQARIDAESSTKQVNNRRLTAMQDLTWALINSSAFLFNR
jgi:WD40 repeat protein/mono/diheme cytochrome c family protein